MPLHQWIVDSSGEELVAAGDAQRTFGQGAMRRIEEKRPFGIL